MKSRATNEGNLRHLLIGDSIERKRQLDALLVIVRQKEREQVIRDLAKSRETDREA